MWMNISLVYYSKIDWYESVQLYRICTNEKVSKMRIIRGVNSWYNKFVSLCYKFDRK
jgi:hypothetical protein